MNRLALAFCAIAILLAACSGPRPAAFVFPEVVGVWKLKLVEDIEAGAVPEPIRRLGVKRARAGQYEGPGLLVAQVHELTSSAAAFECEQQWRPVADTVAFHRGNYFTVVRWKSIDRKAVAEFVREAQKQMGGR